MKRQVQKGFVLVISIVIFMLIAGCEEQSLTGTKKCRLLAAENIQLKKQLNERDTEIEKQKEQLEKYQQEKKAQEEAAYPINPEFVEFIIGENARMMEENEALLAEVESLKQELEELKEKPKLPQGLESF